MYMYFLFINTLFIRIISNYVNETTKSVNVNKIAYLGFFFL